MVWNKTVCIVTIRAHAQISLKALQHNLQRVRQLASGAEIMCVIKANAYGHGLLQVAEVLADADALAVANLDEASRLRSHLANKIPDKKIVILQGVLTQDELTFVCKQNLDIVVHNEQQLQLIEDAQFLSSTPLSVWLKVDTGMHRLGFSPDKVDGVVSRLQQCSHDVTIRMMSHFANADDPSDPLTENQFILFSQVTAQYEFQKSIANSAGIAGVIDCSMDWVRPGIMLYGVNPFIGMEQENIDLLPVMTLSATVISIQQRKKGDAIGYGGTWVCPEDMPIAVISIGYGDGYPRHAETDTPVLVNGNRCPLVGRVSMDMICVDVREAGLVKIGDEVILWGNGLPVEVVAHHSNTIAYELLCKVTPRVLREYT